MNQALQIIREVNDMAAELYDDARSMGEHAAYALRDSHRSQMTGLENIAESTLKFSDVLDYIKKQTARYSYWQKGYPAYKTNPQLAFGERLQNFVEIQLAQRRDIISERLYLGNQSDADRKIRRQIYLQLIRQFIRQMVVHYEYCADYLNRK
jgi:hypothetical protein